MKKLGDIAESAFIAKAISIGYGISVPFGDNLPYDLVLDAYGSLYKVQIKSTHKKDRDTRYDRRTLSYKISVCRGGGSKTRYEKHEVDLYAFFIHPLDLWYLIPFHVIETKTLRLCPHNKEHRLERYRERWQILFEN